MVEESLDNNFTWFPVTLTQQTGVPNVPEITSSATSLVCEGESRFTFCGAPDNTTLFYGQMEIHLNLLKLISWNVFSYCN